jgi:hypothetical protein
MSIWARFKKKFCRYRQLRIPTGTAVIYRGQVRTVVACKWTGAAWRYELTGCKGWIWANNLRVK